MATDLHNAEVFISGVFILLNGVFGIFFLICFYINYFSMKRKSKKKELISEKFDRLVISRSVTVPTSSTPQSFKTPPKQVRAVNVTTDSRDMDYSDLPRIVLQDSVTTVRVCRGSSEPTSTPHYSSNTGGVSHHTHHNSLDSGSGEK